MMNNLFATSEFLWRNITLETLSENFAIQTMNSYSLSHWIDFNPPRLSVAFTESPKSNTTLCWPRPEFTTTAATILNWELLAVNTSVSAHCQSPIQEILTSFVHCPKLKYELLYERADYFWNSMEWIVWEALINSNYYEIALISKSKNKNRAFISTLKDVHFQTVLETSNKIE